VRTGARQSGWPGGAGDLPLSLLLSLLIGPLGVHMFTRKRLAAQGVPMPDREAVIEAMTDAFCRAAATTG